jgi:hypothetical protein
MPNDQLVWIVLIVVAAGVVGLALWKGRGLSVRKNEAGFRLEVKEGQKAQPGSTVSVAKGARIEGSTVGHITGMATRGDDTTQPPTARVDVLEKGTVRNARVGDITGVKDQEKSP